MFGIVTGGVAGFITLLIFTLMVFFLLQKDKSKAVGTVTDESFNVTVFMCSELKRLCLCCFSEEPVAVHLSSKRCVSQHSLLIVTSLTG